ncbi:MAG: ATP-binding cassette domain-containing protein [Candidatus Acetothermia bacterium]|jgi:ABC-2 type transport system ATP-binding protein|nr:ATP-binding cassette domain-containing protein [Candidatus Acetothermia bacterium]
MEAAVEVKNLVKVYNRSVRALDGVDLAVERGTVFALLGPNGAGKTTLIRILTTQLRPTAGEALVFGLDVAKDGVKVRRLSGYVPQEMSVWTDISGYENLLIYAKIYGIPAAERKQVITDVLGKMGILEAARSPVKTYSGGMIRRLEIASALLIRPRILFLDEPTIGLDPSARKAVWKELGLFKREYGVTIFFNTHYMDEADLYADEIAIIDRGKIVKAGTPEELKRSVGGEVITLSLGSNDFRPECVERLRALELVEDVIAEDFEVRVVVKDYEAALPRIMEALREERLSVARVSMTKPTLDDVFLKYAGTRFEAGGRISEVREVRRMIRRG